MALVKILAKSFLVFFHREIIGHQLTISATSSSVGESSAQDARTENT